MTSSPTVRATALTLALLAACSPGENDASDTDTGEVGAGPTVVPVEVSLVERADLRRTITSSTTLRSALEIAVVAEGPGTIAELAADVGDSVERGQTLARIVNEDVRIAIEEAEQVAARARREVERLRPLYDQGFLARQTFDDLAFQLESAETQVRRLQVQSATQVIRSPIRGVVTARRVNRGEVVMPNQSLFTVTVADDLEARVAVPERELAVLREGQPAEIVVQALPDGAFAGRVHRIEPVVDPDTGTIQVRVAIDGPLERDGVTLRPGMFAAVRIVTDVRAGAVAAPKRAVVREGGISYVHVLGAAAEGSAAPTALEEGPFVGLTSYAHRRVPVELGYEDRDLVEVIGDVSVGDRVIVVGQSGLDSETIVVVPRESERAPGDAADD